ncbi:Rpn family recombination-promoting nuclease/putative transposase [Anaerosalibacter bizertensis]|nr:Rpn family recombination-promoting nuclease/putative transposase [Anaerosalibacter bizertensis]MCB5560598.1 Rpn family recombination-promoting nuclease/putative transposase [Anaerosalibacter bizertensis]
MKEVYNPHDKFFKEIFGKVEVTKDFIENYLPENILKIIDTNTLEPQKDSFITEDLEEIFSDMLFKVNINNKEGYIYLLFEHKSYKEKNISFQLLKYMIEIWEAKINKEKTYQLPIIIPLVIYHGKDRWNLSTNLGELIVGYENLTEDIKKHIPNYEYLIYDLSQYTDDDIKGEAQLRIILTIFRDIFIKDNKGIQESVERAARYLKELEDKQTGIEYFETFIRYIISARPNLTRENMEDMRENVNRIYPEGSEVIMTIIERYREEGRQEGRLEGKIEVAKKLIKMDLTIDEIIEATGLKKEEIYEIRKKILN